MNDSDVAHFSLRFRAPNTTTTHSGLGLPIYDGELKETTIGPEFFKEFVKDLHCKDTPLDYPFDATMDDLRRVYQENNYPDSPKILFSVDSLTDIPTGGLSPEMLGILLTPVYHFSNQNMKGNALLNKKRRYKLNVMFDKIVSSAFKKGSKTHRLFEKTETLNDNEGFQDIVKALLEWVGAKGEALDESKKGSIRVDADKMAVDSGPPTAHPHWRIKKFYFASVNGRRKFNEREKAARESGHEFKHGVITSLTGDVLPIIIADDEEEEMSVVEEQKPKAASSSSAAGKAQTKSNQKRKATRAENENGEALDESKGRFIKVDADKIAVYDRGSCMEYPHWHIKKLYFVSVCGLQDYNERKNARESGHELKQRVITSLKGYAPIGIADEEEEISVVEEKDPKVASSSSAGGKAQKKSNSSAKTACARMMMSSKKSKKGGVPSTSVPCYLDFSLSVEEDECGEED
eukprot:scaffold178847_cov56-Attheya_sp.AAC.1